MADRSNGAAKKDTLTRSINALKVFFFAFIAFALFILIYYCLADNSIVAEPEKVSYIDQWTVTDPDGRVFTTGRYFRDTHYYSGAFTITAQLPDDISDNSLLCFTLNGDTDIYISDETEPRRSFSDAKDVVVPGGQVKRFYYTVPLNSSDSGKQVIMIKNSFSRHPEVVPETFVTGIGGMYSELFTKYGVSFSISAVLLIFSFVVIMIGIGLRFWYHASIGMLYGALGIFVIAAWLITNSYLFPFVFGHYHVDGVINYMMCLLLPFGLVLYLDSVQHGRYRKFVTIVLVISSIDAVVWTALHFLGIFPFYRALLYIDIILGLLAAAAAVILIIDFVKGNTRQYKYTFIGFMTFFMCGFAEIIALTFFTLKQDDFPMLIGLALLLGFIIFQQVDDLRRINLEKQHAIDLSDAKTKFLANMSHEIRTPINSILGMNEMILRENKDKVINGYAQNVRNSGKMLLMLVNDVLDFSKIEAGKIEITNVNYSLSRLLADILTMFTERARMKNLDLVTVVEGDVPDGQIGDEIRIKQILVNLISNAVKYTDKGTITLSVSGNYSDNDHFNLNLSVKDTGRGIKPEELDVLFDAFSRADIKNNRNIEGTGLGLAIVKSIVDSMGGTVTVESEYEKGSCFNVTIPVEITDRTPVATDFNNVQFDTGEQYKCDYTAPSARVLAVDDNHSNLTIVRLFLKETGIIPDLCSSGTDAIRKCETEKYDLILLDHMMPAPDGIETLKVIRNIENGLNKETPAVVLTANAVAGSRQLYMDAGFDDYLTKPLDSKQLEMTVKKYLPADKIVPLTLPSAGVSGSSGVNDMYFVQEFIPIEDKDPEEAGTAPDADTAATGNTDRSNLEERLSIIKGLDYDAALTHCGDDEDILIEILGDVAAESGERIARMQKSIADNDYEAYCIDAHAIKGLMATIGLEELSDLARKHEFAARDKDTLFIEKDMNHFLNEYGNVCTKLKALLG